MEIFFLVCLIGFTVGAAVGPKEEIVSETALPGIYGIDDDEKVCIENYLNGEVLDVECEGSIENVIERLVKRFGDYEHQLKCARDAINDYKYKDVYLLYEYNAKTHGKTRELSKLGQAAVAGLTTFCHESVENFPNHIVYRFESQELNLEQAQCAYRFAIEKELIRQSDYNINPKDFAAVDCKSYYEEWRSKFTKHYEVDISDESHRSEFEKCVHNRPSLINHELELFVLGAVARLTDLGASSLIYQSAYDKTMFIKERSGLECIRELASKVIARN